MMSRITVCPQCHTRFRVTEEQLQARRGDLRCGRCNHIFNAAGTLLDETPLPELPEKTKPSPQQSMPEKPQPPIPVEAEAPAQAQEIAAENPATEEAEAVTHGPVQLETSIAAGPEEKTQAEIPPEPVPEPEIRVVRIQPPALKEPPKVSPERPKYGPPPKPKRAWPWVLASLPLLLGLAGQGVYFFRDAIAASYPPVRPLLEAACVPLQCDIRLLQNPDLISIETSELHADPARASIVVLTSTLRNRAPHTQAYPILELTLTNARDEMVAKRLFLPKEYMRQTAAIAQGIPAKGEVAVKLLMDLGELKAEGYRLYLFYPS